MRTTEDLADVPDPEAEAYANVGASTSLPDLAVGAAANVRTPTSPPVLEMVAAANVGATTSLVIGQTTHTNLRSEVNTDIGRAIGGDSAPVASEFPHRRPHAFRH